MFTELKPNANAAGLRIGIAVSRYHGAITDAMRDGAIQQAILALSEENLQLKQTVEALRAEMERAAAAQAERTRELERQHQSATAQLQSTVQDLRSQLEQRREG